MDGDTQAEAEAIPDHPGADRGTEDGRRAERPRPSRPNTSGKPTPFPRDFTITADLDQYAAQHAPNADVERELEKCRLWAADKGATSQDWHARFCSWLVNAEERTTEKQYEAFRRPDGTWERRKIERKKRLAY